MYGSSFAANPLGETICKASRDKSEVLIANLDFQVFDLWNKLFPLKYQRQPATYKKLIEQ